MTQDEIQRGLIAMGVPREKAVALAGGRVAEIINGEKPAAKAMVFPLHVVLPWSALCSDNYREEASLTVRGGKTFPRKLLSARYKAARDKARALGVFLADGALPVERPLSLHARVYVPDEHIYDVCNFAKGVHDALEGVVYRNDRWLWRTLWERAGVDVDHPRAEITITPLSESSP